MARKGRRPQTIITYRSALNNTVRFLQDEGMEDDPRRIGEDEVVRIIKDYGASEATLQHYITVLAKYLDWYGNGIIKEMGILWNRPAHPNARWVTAEEFQRVIEAAGDPTDRVIIMLAAYAGMRRGEIANLRLGDILSDRLVITGKGHGNGKQRIIPLSAKVGAEIARYMAWRDTVAPRRDEGLVVGIDPRTRRYTPLSDKTVGHRASAVCRAAGIDASLHSFRRYFATQVWQAMPDKDVRVLQELLGHTSPVMTMHYITISTEDMAVALDRL